MVVKMFSDVENKNVEAPKWSDQPFAQKHFETKWHIVPIKDIRNLNITFSIPDLQEHYKSAVIRIRQKISLRSMRYRDL